MYQKILKTVTNISPYFLLCTSLMVTAHAESQIKTASAKIEQFTLLKDSKGNQGKFVLDFVGIFEVGVDGEYQRYLKQGYPYLSKHDFEQHGPGGMAVFNHSKKLRTLYTTKNTLFKAHCINAPSADDFGQVFINLKEFSLVLDRNNGTNEEWNAFIDKFKGCYSQNADLVNLTYRGRYIKSISFVWMP